MNKFILGLDTSSTCCGWSVFRVETGNPKLESYGKIIVPKDLSHLDKYNYIIEKLSEIYERIGPHGAIVAIEQPNSFRNGAIVRLLCGLYGVVRLHFYNKYKVELIEINTMTAKKCFTGVGGADKAAMVKMANLRFKLKLKYKKTDNKEQTDEDIADSMGIAITAWSQIKVENWKKKSMASLSKQAR